jgi:hypothetical protein
MRSRSKTLPLTQPITVPLSPGELVARTLMISIPLSMLAGALIAALAFWIWR